MSHNQKISISYGLGNVKLRSGEEIIGFQIEVSGGGFESISSLPKGWRIAIDNRSVSQTRLNADLAFGAETLSADALSNLVVKLSQIELDGQNFHVTGHLVVTNGAGERNVSLASQNFVRR